MFDITYQISTGTLSAIAVATTLLAAIPSASVLAVCARAATDGFRHGLYTTLGIAVGDLGFLIVALLGLTSLASVLDASAVWISMLAGLCLIGIGVTSWRSGGAAAHSESRPSGHTGSSSFLLGFAITAGDQKALLFYLGFLPAFVELDSLTLGDGILVASAVLLPLTGTKLIYAAAASRAGMRVSPRLARWLGGVAACVLMAVGVWLVVRSLPGLLRVYAGVGMELWSGCAA